MQTVVITISMIVAVAIGATTSVGLGILIALACVVYQVILEYGRSSTASSKTTVQRALLRDIVRNGVFLIPLVGALLSGLWLAVLATVVVDGVNLYLS